MTIHQTLSIIAVLSLSVLLILKSGLFKKTGLNKTWRLGLFAAKIVASLGILALYSWYYPKETADLYKYFEDGKIIYETADSPKTWFHVISGTNMDDPAVKTCTDAANHWDRKYLKGVWNDNRSIIRLNAFLYPLTGGSLIAHCFAFAFLGYLGLTLLFLGIKRFVKGNKWLALAVFMIPNLFLWSSGLLKEALLILNLGILFFAASKLYDRFTIKHALLLIIGASLFITTKIYVLICMLPALTFFILARKRKHKLAFFASVHVITIALILTAGYFSDKADLLHVMDRKQQDFINMVEQSENVGSDVEVPNVDASVSSLIFKAPVGFMHSFFRPHPLEWDSPVKLLAGLENILLIALLLFSIIKSRKLSHDQWNFLLFSLSFTIIFYSVIGLSTPVLGALVRYKIAALPFIGTSILLMFNTARSPKKQPRIFHIMKS